MKINNFENYDYDLQKIKKLFKQMASQKKMSAVQNQNNPLPNQDNSSHLPVDIPPANKKLDQSLQTLLFKTWLEMNLPLKEKYISKLINYVNVKTDLKPESLINAFGFLLKNRLPLLPELIDGIARNLNSNKSLSKLLDARSLGQNNNEKNSSLSANIKSKLTFKLNQPPSKMIKKLKNYPEMLKQNLNLSKSGPEKAKKFFHHLLGQQALNLPETKKEIKLLLTLELPVIFKKEDNPLPLHLQVKRYNEKTGEKSKDDKSFKLGFIIDLEKKGPVKADIIIQSNHIQCKFITLSSNTAKIIETTFPLLKERLETLKFQVEAPVINQVKNEKKFNNTEPYSESSIPGQKKKKDTQPGENFIHFDFKV